LIRLFNTGPKRLLPCRRIAAEVTPWNARLREFFRPTDT
jgi:hypothetical protein